MSTTLSQPAFDAAGRALPLPDDEERWRAAEAFLDLDTLSSMGDKVLGQFVDARIWDQISP